jgi:hypothetical protein
MFVETFVVQTVIICFLVPVESRQGKVISLKQV